MATGRVLSHEAPRAQSIDLSGTTVMKDYPTAFLKVIDNVFTSEECAALVARAEISTPWSTAMIQSFGRVRVDTEVRNNDRILLFDHEVSKELFERLFPHVEEFTDIVPGGKWENVARRRGSAALESWKLFGLNERLSFLRYGPGHYFKPHFDGQIALPDGRQSWVTVQIYLNEKDLFGGATRIFDKHEGYFDVEPKVGRVLIFEQGPFLHSGEEVERGLKYTMRTDFLFIRASRQALEYFANNFFVILTVD
ncbi:hypothetical protein H0H92_002052 [Tricholoma furcatifolium]|nr:hypothetical protein H0H92_002052 [Tricholoma furcatifolium]